MSKHSLEHFRLYAPFIGQVLTAWPGPILVQSAELTPNTLAEYIRRALKGKRLHGWHSDRLDEGLWILYGDKIFCQVVPEGVRMGSREAISTRPDPKISVANASNEIAVHSSDYTVLASLCVITGQRILEPAPIFVISATDEQAQQLSINYPDVVIEPTSTGQYRIL